MARGYNFFVAATAITGLCVVLFSAAYGEESSSKDEFGNLVVRAEQGDPDAQFELGSKYKHKYCERDK